ncbi:MAG: putative colanic acid biosynthesis acetyltransferase [Pseudomonadales bacterium]|nr:putative colanic acid biosynthesis acetyltransferase [Pseudomonadales bacterium]
MYQKLDEFKLPSNFRGRSVLVVQLWWFVEATLFGLSPQFLYGWRRFLLRLFGAKIGANVIIRPSVKITYPWKLSIGKNSWIGDNVDLYTLGEISIGENAVVSQRSYLCTGSHDYKSLAFDIYAKPIIIENEAWVSADVYIAPGVTVGAGTVIGARSSVFKSTAKGVVCVGSPAVSIKSRLD